MAFPMAALTEVQRAVMETGKECAIVGYRISPEEVHGVLLATGYDACPEGSEKSCGKIIKEQVSGRCPVIIVSHIWSADDALDALNHGDMIALARAALNEPELTKKIRENRAQMTQTKIKHILADLHVPPKAIVYLKW